MIHPSDADIGRGVIYQASYPEAPKEDGVITRVVDSGTVFVRYSKQHPGACGQATSCSDLEWLID